ncbi:YicC family protein [Oxalobacteraceae bacterium CAVE-383]|nr:YicC family protein [Oxalobacteraceae bacterium CAVE-383]
MTGYAIHTRETAAGTVTIELKSVNSRFLDLQFRVNDDLRSLEPALREAIIGRVVRGKLECRLSFGRKTAGASQTVNAELLASLASLQQQLRSRPEFIDAAPLSIAELLRWPGMIEESEVGQDSLQQDVGSAMQAALDAFIESRAREGAALQEVLLSRIDMMEAIVARITPLVPQLVAQFQQRASERLQDALGLAHVQQNGAPNLTREETLERIRQEVTLYGIRIDIAEELARLGAHLSETRHILKKGGQVGKRLDFMMQELNREANTVGSKAAMKELADAAMELKLLIDQMREQVQNLE